MKALILILQLFLLGLLVACGPMENAGESDLTIIGGQNAEVATDSVVRLAQRGQGYCTGVLVSRDLVITAAHCLHQTSSEELKLLFPRAAAGEREISASRIERVRDDALLFFPNFDMGWVKLARPAPEPYRPAKILGNTQSVAIGTEMQIVGVANESACHGPQDECRLMQLPVRLKSLWSSSHLVHLAVAESLNQNQSSGTCPGDSGGPMFVRLNGETLLFGIVAGKDPIFTSGSTNACGSPLTVLTRVGEYRSWIESTSGAQLDIHGPASTAFPDLNFLTSTAPDDGERSGWARWFREPLALQDSWATVHKILEQVVLQFQEELDPNEIPEIFQSGGQSYIERITSLRSLTLGFPEQTMPIQDLRPLESLKNLEDLTFLVRPYTGLATIAKLSKLKTLSLVGRGGGSARISMQLPADWSQLSSAHLDSLRISQLSLHQLSGLQLERFTRLRTLAVATPIGVSNSSWFRAEGLQNLNTLQVQEWSCDQGVWPSQPLNELTILNLRTTGSLNQSDIECIDWSRLPGLSQLRLEGYSVNISGLKNPLPANLASQLDSGG